MTAVVSNSTSLIALSILGRFELLRKLFGTVRIPPAVYHEITATGADRIGAAEVVRGVAEGWIQVEAITATDTLTTLKVDLDDGEAEAIALALEGKADLLLLDERKARAKAQALRLEITGTIGILLLAREMDLEIDLQLALDKLRENGFRIGDALCERIVEKARKG